MSNLMYKRWDYDLFVSVIHFLLSKKCKVTKNDSIL